MHAPPTPNRQALLALALLGLGACPSGGPQTTVRLVDGRPQETRYVSAAAYEHYVQAQVALGRGRLQAAMDEFREALILDPDSPHLHTELATVLTQLGKLRDAHAELGEALRSRADYPDALVLQGQLFRLEHRPDDAERSFRRCVRANPGHAPAYLQLATLLEKAAEGPDRARAEASARQAAEVLRQMIQRVKGEVRLEGHRRLALLCLRQVDYSCAAKHFEEALHGEPDLDTLLKLAHVYRAVGRFPVAIRLLREAFDRSGGNHQVAAALLDLLHHQGTRQQAVDLLGVLETAAEEVPERTRQVAELALGVGEHAWALNLVERQLRVGDTTGLQITRGVALWRAGRVQEGQAALEGLLDGPAGAAAARRLSLLLGERGQHARAVAILRQALTRHGHDVQLVLDLSRALYHQGKGPASVQVVRTALLGHPDDRMLRFGLAAALERTGAWREALGQIEKMLERHPNDGPALNFLGYTLADRGQQLERAEHAIRRALFLHPGEGYIMDSLGWLCFRRGERGRAATLLEMAVRLAPDEAEIIAHLAEVQVTLRRVPRAVQLMRQAVAASDDPRLTARLTRRLRELERGVAPGRPKTPHGARTGARDTDNR